MVDHNHFWRTDAICCTFLDAGWKHIAKIETVKVAKFFSNFGTIHANKDFLLLNQREGHCRFCTFIGVFKPVRLKGSPAPPNNLAGRIRLLRKELSQTTFE
jgi:hypothetical protein